MLFYIFLLSTNRMKSPKLTTCKSISDNFSDFPTLSVALSPLVLTGEVNLLKNPKYIVLIAKSFYKTAGH